MKEDGPSAKTPFLELTPRTLEGTAFELQLLAGADGPLAERSLEQRRQASRKTPQ